MPHVDDPLRVATPAQCASLRTSLADPALWAWLAVALMSILPLRAAFGGG